MSRVAVRCAAGYEGQDEGLLVFVRIDGKEQQFFAPLIVNEFVEPDLTQADLEAAVFRSLAKAFGQKAEQVCELGAGI